MDTDKKQNIIIGVLVLLIILTAAYLTFSTIRRNNISASGEPLIRYKKLDTSKEYDENTPEYLAIKSGEIQFDLLTGAISAQDAYDILYLMAGEHSRTEMEKQKSDFYDQARATINFLDSLGEEIVKITHSQIIPHPEREDRVSIMKIVEFTTLKNYYRQDFILENGQWRIYGDNGVNEFRIR